MDQATLDKLTQLFQGVQLQDPFADLQPTHEVPTPSFEVQQLPTPVGGEASPDFPSFPLPTHPRETSVPTPTLSPFPSLSDERESSPYGSIAFPKPLAADPVNRADFPVPEVAFPEPQEAPGTQQIPRPESAFPLPEREASEPAGGLPGPEIKVPEPGTNVLSEFQFPQPAYPVPSQSEVPAAAFNPVTGNIDSQPVKMMAVLTAILETLRNKERADQPFQSPPTPNIQRFTWTPSF